ncbi:MAG: PQQ-dependent sugar dehydrogenase [Deltaproteobacteria bacterium]
MLGRRSLVASCLTVPLMTMAACVGGESGGATPGVGPEDSAPADSNVGADPPASNEPAGGMAPVNASGEVTPSPRLDPGTTPEGEVPGPEMLVDLGSFTKTTLHERSGEPVALAVLPDGRVLHTVRGGRIWLHGLDGTNSVAADIPVYSHDEDGLQGIALDPDFSVEPWIYVYYSPQLATPLGDAPLVGNAAAWQPYVGVNRLSRFLFHGSALDLGSEQMILEVPGDRGICCHTGGHIDFDGAGNLYLSTGDDTNPGMSDGYTPIDERPDRNPGLDAQRSAGNTADLRGKLLRIHVENDGSYTTPEGNLFPPSTAGTRPEIYAMGLRNPYRFAVNRATNEVYLADYAPDNGMTNPTRGPGATGKWLVVRRAANYGWPYCIGHLAYVDYDFATGTSAAPFNCDSPRNESPRNTGLVDLPPVTDPEFVYNYGFKAGYPALGGGGIGPMAGPMYVFDPASTSPIKWPERYSGGIVFYEWTRDLIALFRLGDDGAVSSLEQLPPEVTAENPIDVEFGPDGALYVLEYGEGYYRANEDARLTRIEYRRSP